MRSSVRADRMCQALLLCRADAQSDTKLDFALLKRWHMRVMGSRWMSEFRKFDAYAKEGRERYPIKHIKSFDGVLKDAMDAKVDARVRAARAYLDVCFFHPFTD